MRHKARLTAAALLAVPVLLAACGQALPQNTLHPDSPISRKIDSLFTPIFWIAVGVFVFVEGLLLVILFKYRHREGGNVPKQVHGNKRLEIGWTLAPTLLLAGVAVFTIPVIFQLAGRPVGPDVLNINVTGHQWWWEAEYPSLKVVTANEIHIPTGQRINITLRSVDVIHSFWVPRLAGKQDLEPGRINHLTIEADRPGTYLGQCAEFCGDSHANMRLRVMAQTPADFQAWAQSQSQPATPPPPPALNAMQSAGCGGCHTINGVEGLVGTIGPNLTHFGSRTTFAGSIFPNDPDHLRAWIHDAPSLKPGADMPSFANRLSDQDLDALVAYLESLK